MYPRPMSAAIWLKYYFYEHLWMFRWHHSVCETTSKPKVLVACICIFSFDFPRREADRLIIQSCSVHQFCKFYLRFTGFVCANALPATDFDVLLQRPSRRTLLAFEATFLLVCFEFFIIAIPPFYRFSCYTPRNLIQFTVKMYLMR